MCVCARLKLSFFNLSIWRGAVTSDFGRLVTCPCTSHRKEVQGTVPQRTINAFCFDAFKGRQRFQQSAGKLTKVAKLPSCFEVLFGNPISCGATCQFASRGLGEVRHFVRLSPSAIAKLIISRRSLR